MDILGFVALTVTGFTSCAEFGSYAFVHPVIRELPREQHVQVEKGLLKTFGAHDARCLRKFGKVLNQKREKLNLEE